MQNLFIYPTVDFFSRRERTKLMGNAQETENQQQQRWNTPSPDVTGRADTRNNV
jgi:hypothetical protein